MRKAALPVLLVIACGGGDDGGNNDGDGGGGDGDGSTEQDARPNDGNVGDGTPSVPGSLRFFGTGSGGIDRVEIAIDPQVPADVGAGDFTIDFWVRTNSLMFTWAETCTTGANGWQSANVVVDRDRMGNGDHGDYGIAITRGGIAFGVSQGAAGAGLCGTRNVVDGTWHHVAVTRVASTGALSLYVDGNPDGTATGPTGDVSYRDGATGAAKDPFLVLAAEKHDTSGSRSFNGWMDELRISTTVRYTAAFTPETMPYAVDADTAALYHFDEGDGNALTDARGMSPGDIKVGQTPTGTVPVWASATPFLL
ncbi:MAG: LamG domain-containing protein [Deltaproteobacteria bacterium]|nr:LamG domain-containing protein [Kofleriaceae bacterium]